MKNIALLEKMIVQLCEPKFLREPFKKKSPDKIKNLIVFPAFKFFTHSACQNSHKWKAVT